MSRLLEDAKTYTNMDERQRDRKKAKDEPKVLSNTVAAPSTTEKKKFEATPTRRSSEGRRRQAIDNNRVKESTNVLGNTVATPSAKKNTNSEATPTRRSNRGRQHQAVHNTPSRASKHAAKVNAVDETVELSSGTVSPTKSA
jgi:hypothetical protein